MFILRFFSDRKSGKQGAGFFILAASKVEDAQGVLRFRAVRSKTPSPIFEEVARPPHLPSDLRTDLRARRTKMGKVVRSPGPKIGN